MDNRWITNQDELEILEIEQRNMEHAATTYTRDLWYDYEAAKKAYLNWGIGGGHWKERLWYECHDLRDELVERGEDVQSADELDAELGR